MILHAKETSLSILKVGNICNHLYQVDAYSKFNKGLNRKKMFWPALLEPFYS